MTVTHSSIFSNTAASSGGGIFIGPDTRLYLENSTISGNRQNGGNFDLHGGGGVSLAGPAILVHTTIANNLAATKGDGLWLNNPLAKVETRNSRYR